MSAYVGGCSYVVGDMRSNERPSLLIRCPSPSTPLPRDTVTPRHGRAPALPTFSFRGTLHRNVLAAVYGIGVSQSATSLQQVQDQCVRPAVPPPPPVIATVTARVNAVNVRTDSRLGRDRSHARPQSDQSSCKTPDHGSIIIIY